MIGMLFFLLYGCRSNLDQVIENSQPTIEIISQQDPNTFGDGYTFEFVASVQDKNHSYQELQVAWFSNDEIACDWQKIDPDGQTRCQIRMREEYEWISAKVVDPDQDIGIDSIPIVVHPTYAPEVLIVSPKPSERYYSDKPIEFQANVFDAEDDVSNLTMQWYSDVDDILNLDFHNYV